MFEGSFWFAMAYLALGTSLTGLGFFLVRGFTGLGLMLWFELWTGLEL